MDAKKKLLLGLSKDAAIDTTCYWGMDASDYPGDEKMQNCWSNSLLYYTGFYLAPAPYHPDDSWMNRRGTLSSQGWGFLPIYVGRQADSSHLTEQQGIDDAQNAAQLASNAGFPSLTYIYLDIEQGGTISDDFITYIKAWVNEIQTNSSYWAAIYCSYYDTADQIKAALDDSRVRYWVFHLSWSCSSAGTGTAPNPANSGVSYAITWQLVQNCSKTYDSSTISPVDISSSTMTDPSR